MELMAGSAQLSTTEEFQQYATRTDTTIVIPRDMVQEAAARLYGLGYKRPRVAKIMVDHLVPNGKHRPLEQRVSQARRRLHVWEKSDKFRDLIYQEAVAKADLAIPEILGGVAKKAARGRVDAARLILEITGRHNPKGDIVPTQVNISFSGVPRPPGLAHETIEADVIEEEDV